VVFGFFIDLGFVTHDGRRRSEIGVVFSWALDGEGRSEQVLCIWFLWLLFDGFGPSPARGSPAGEVWMRRLLLRYGRRQL
jgi:hypothetical protein